MNDYYVYVYIDPRNLQEFYFGKGKGSRKDAHLFDTLDSQKTRRIAAIRAEGLEPIIRVIARNLTEGEALLIEKTLLWKLGRQLTNISTGHYADKFRPQDTLHQLLPGFDFQRGVYYYNVTEGPHRNWDDYVKFGFISAGHGPRWRDAMLEFVHGDVVAAYFQRRGYVGIGVLTDRARPAREVQINGKPLLKCDLKCTGMASNSGSDERCEYVATVRWIKTVPREESKWEPRAGLFTSQLVRASLAGQPKTLAFLDKAFGVDLRSLIV